MASKLNIHDDRIPTGYESEGFFISTETDTPFFGINNNYFPFSPVECVRARMNNLLSGENIKFAQSAVSDEELLCHGEIKNPLPIQGWQLAIGALNNHCDIVQSSLKPFGVNLSYQPFMSDRQMSSYDFQEEHLTERGRELRSEKGWTDKMFMQTLVSGFQVNRSIPYEIIEAEKELEFVKEMYNLTYSNYEDICAAHNEDSRRTNSIADLLSKGDVDIYPDNPTISYRPGRFRSIQEMQNYFTTKSRVSSTIAFDPKNLHSLTIKPKVSTDRLPETVSQFIPTFIEWRMFDSFDTRVNPRKVEEIMRTIISIERLAVARILDSSNSQLQFYLMEHLASSLGQTDSLAV